MNSSRLKKSLVLGVAAAAFSFISQLHAATAVEVFVEGGSASQNVLYDRATNLFSGGTFTSTGTGKSTVRQFVGTSGNAALAGLNITLDINIANGAIAGLQALVNQTPGPGDTNVNGTALVPAFVDSATTPDAIGISSTANHLVDLPTYVVPLVYAKNTAYSAIAGITNLTQRQAVTLETSLAQAAYFGAPLTDTNLVYFVGRNSQSAVRTEIDLNINNTANILTYYTNSLGLPTQDTSPDPGISSGGTEASTILALTNSIGEVAVQNLTGTLTALAYEGVNYSVTNVINGSYPLWGYEHYYYIASPNNGTPTANQLAVLNAFYAGVTNASFQVTSNPTFSTNFVPISALLVSRSADGGQISPLPNY